VLVELEIGLLASLLNHHPLDMQKLWNRPFQLSKPLTEMTHGLRNANTIIWQEKAQEEPRHTTKSFVYCVNQWKRKEHLRTTGMEDIRKTESEPFVAFLHVPMPTALRPSFLPLQGSLSSRNNSNRHMHWFFLLNNCVASRKEEERVLKNNRNGRHWERQSMLPPLTRGGNN
jgi:hypothetical protein